MVGDGGRVQVGYSDPGNSAYFPEERPDRPSGGAEVSNTEAKLCCTAVSHHPQKQRFNCLRIECVLMRWRTQTVDKPEELSDFVEWL